MRGFVDDQETLVCCCEMVVECDSDLENGEDCDERTGMVVVRIFDLGENETGVCCLYFSGVRASDHIPERKSGVSAWGAANGFWSLRVSQLRYSR